MIGLVMMYKKAHGLDQCFWDWLPTSRKALTYPSAEGKLLESRQWYAFIDACPLRMGSRDNGEARRD